MKRKFFFFIWLIFMVWGGWSWFSEASGSAVNTSQAMFFPNSEFWLGTDSLGRNLWVRAIQGGFLSTSIALVSLAVAFAMGIVTGSAAALRGGWADLILMRINEIVMSLPSVILIGAVFISFRQTTIFSLAAAIGIIQSFHFSRWVRSLIIAEKNKSYITSALAMGSGQARVLTKHIWPNILPQIVMYLRLQFPAFILYETFVSFFGFGLQAPTPSWGLLLQDGWKVLSSYPHVLLGPASIVLVMMFSVYQFSRGQTAEVELSSL
jgi:oligopeptide transport system permease protein